jgi:hypothetical protein
MRVFEKTDSTTIYLIWDMLILLHCYRGPTTHLEASRKAAFWSEALIVSVVD